MFGCNLLNSSDHTTVTDNHVPLVPFRSWLRGPIGRSLYWISNMLATYHISSPTALTIRIVSLRLTHAPHSTFVSRRHWFTLENVVGVIYVLVPIICITKVHYPVACGGTVYSVWLKGNIVMTNKKSGCVWTRYCFFHLPVIFNKKQRLNFGTFH